MQAKPDGKLAQGEAPPIVQDVLNSSGQPLDSATRAYFEPRFGWDFSQVRIHADNRGAASAQAVNARAYTVGSSIVLGAGNSPQTRDGQSLLAHELGHVVQQHNGCSPATLRRQEANPDPAAAQKKCVQRLGGCPDADRSGIPSCGEIATYNARCRNETSYSGPDVVADCPNGWVPNCDTEPKEDEAPEQKPAEQQPADKQQTAPPPPSACTTKFAKANSFQEVINLVKAAESKLSAAGISTPKDQIHALRGIYYGTTWSLDFTGDATNPGEASETRNEGFQRFTRPSEDPGKTVPKDVRGILDCGLFDALKASQDVPSQNVPSPAVKVDFGHLIIALDARYDPDMAKEVRYPYAITSVAMGGTGTELVTWLGDLGGGASKVASARAARGAVSVSEAFSAPSDYGGTINLEGDVAGVVVATSSPTQITAPNIPAGKTLSEALADYLTPPAAAPGAATSSAWQTRAHTFLAMYGGQFDASGTLTNGPALIGLFAPKIQTFACNYLSSRVKDKHETFALAKKAAENITPASEEVAETFVNALADSAKTGDKIEAKRPPAQKPPVPGACGQQINAAGLLQMLP